MCKIASRTTVTIGHAWIVYEVAWQRAADVAASLSLDAAVGAWRRLS